ncbi:MAG: hypothetical protein QI199_05890 [Candidatus Korarchaeota archaeon]|nr:hypothetical protein [Candidatus Korarchaeota archaeon]
MKPFAVSLVLLLAIVGAALFMLGSGIRDWRAYAALILAPTGTWLAVYGYVYRRGEFYYYGGWGAILVLGSVTAALTPVLGSLRAVGLAIVVLAVIVVLAEAARR